MAKQHILKDVRALLLSVSILMLLVGCTSCSYKTQTKELGIPLAKRYPNTPAARVVWDMALFNEQLYVASGDYITNSGPVDMWRYDLSARLWEWDGTLPEEEVNRFILQNNQLFIPGIDSRNDWSFGNYYVRDSRAWKAFKTIPGGIHVFDLVPFQDNLFVGIGAKRGKTPILCSANYGQTFEEIQMQKGGVELDTQSGECIRAYDFFVVHDTLYATFWFEDTVNNKLIFDLYRYQNEVFVFDNTWSNKIGQLPLWNIVIGGKAVFNDTLFFTTGYLYATQNMTDIEHIQFPHSEFVYDILLESNSLYVLCGREINNEWQISVWENKSGDVNDFQEILYFNYDLPAMSFCKSGNTFFFGMGEKGSDDPLCGMILQATIST